MLDEATGLIQFPYIDRARRAVAEEPAADGFSKYVLETREPLLIIEDVAG